MTRNANSADAWIRQRDAESNARVANFRATDGADMVLAPNNRGYAAQRQAILAGQTNANAALKDANAGVITANQPPAANALNQGVAVEGAITGATDAQAKATAAKAQGVIAGAVSGEQEAKAKQQKNLTDLGAKLAAEKDPKKRQALQETILTMLGKEKGSPWKMMHAAGGEVVGADGISKTRLPDSMVAYNEQTGEREVIQLGGGEKGKAAKPPLDDWLKQATAANPGKSQDELKKFYASKYGQ
jgi:hypothetical protein